MGRAHRALPGRRYDRKEWCALNKVAESSLCKWMARFREEDPGRFPRRSSEVSSWMRVTRRGPGGGAASPFSAPGTVEGDGRHPFRGEEIDDEALEVPGLSGSN